jgi:hypothetical protein
MKQKVQIIFYLTIIFFLGSCGSSEDPIEEVDCATSNLALSISSTTDTSCGGTDGSITLAASGGGGIYSYKIDEGSFGSSNVLTSLSPGSYQVTVKDNNECEVATDVSILSGTSYEASIKTIIETNCAISGCHVSGTGRQNFTGFSTIQGNAAGIKTRTQNKTMPQTGSITQEQINLIACWVDDGAQNN